eukprot:TRINITY_DN3355_c0_g1_i1.p1 TRINITY_DN3355_c0_g1~~TRINITY_DN3355_c0_g1_i1.p1  ORF type:complete len:420 (+),score=94.05 TRINITY_DN3355_c0_g1_i1:62-1321(+)
MDNTDKLYQRKIQSLVDSLENKDSDWQEIQSIMKEIESSVVSRHLVLDAWALNLMKVPLVEHCATVKSQLCVTACELIGVIASTCATEFASHAKFFMHGLLAVVPAGHAVRGNAAHEAVVVIVENIPPKACMVPVFQSAVDLSNDKLRIRCIGYIKLAFERHSTPHIRSILKHVVGVLPTTLGDADSSVRATSRDIFLLVENVSNKAATDIYQKSDYTVQKAIDKICTGTYHSPNGPGTPEKTRTPDKPPIRRLSSTRNLRERRESMEPHSSAHSTRDPKQRLIRTNTQRRQSVQPVRARTEKEKKEKPPKRLSLGGTRDLGTPTRSSTKQKSMTMGRSSGKSFDSPGFTQSHIPRTGKRFSNLPSPKKKGKSRPSIRDMMSPEPVIPPQPERENTKEINQRRVERLLERTKRLLDICA